MPAPILLGWRLARTPCTSWRAAIRRGRRSWPRGRWLWLPPRLPRSWPAGRGVSCRWSWSRDAPRGWTRGAGSETSAWSTWRRCSWPRWSLAGQKELWNQVGINITMRFLSLTLQYSFIVMKWLVGVLSISIQAARFPAEGWSIFTFSPWVHYQRGKTQGCFARSHFEFTSWSVFRRLCFLSLVGLIDLLHTSLSFFAKREIDDDPNERMSSISRVS